MKIRVVVPLVILLIFSYLIFIFPFEIISSWLGRSTSLQETMISTAFVYLICLYYFRSKSSNKIIKFFVYEGLGIGTVSLFIVFLILIISLVFAVSESQKVFIFFIIFFPSVIFGFLNAKKVSVRKLKFSHVKIKNKAIKGGFPIYANLRNYRWGDVIEIVVKHYHDNPENTIENKFVNSLEYKKERGVKITDKLEFDVTTGSYDGSWDESTVSIYKYFDIIE